MESLLFSFNIIAPVFLMGMIGYYLRQKEMITGSFVTQATGLCFDLLLPCMLFRSVYTADRSNVGDMRLFWYCFLGNLFVIVAAAVIVPLFIKEKKKIGTVVQAIFRSNVMLVGLSILQSTYGKEGADCAAFLIAPVISMFTIASVIVFAVFDETNGVKLSFKTVFLKIVKNHYIIALSLGLICLGVEIRLPIFAEKTVNYLADIATPFSLLMLGGQFSFANAQNNLRFSLITSFIRLVIVPGIFVAGGIMLGYSGPPLLTILVLFGSSCAASCAAMALRSGGDHQLAGEITFISTFFSVFTLFGFIAVLRSAGLL